MGRVKLIGEYCKHFRVNVLGLTLRVVCSKTDTNIKTLSAFEMGRSNNMEHIFKYVEVCNNEQKIMLTTGIAYIMRGFNNGN